MAWWFLSLIGASVAPDSIAYRGFCGWRLRRNLHAKPRNRLRGYAVGLRGYAVFVGLQGVIGVRSYAAKSEFGLLLKFRILLEAVLGKRPLYRGYVRAIAAI